MDTQLEIGSINRAHGINGEVIVNLISNAPERLVPGAKFQTSKNGQSQLIVQSVRSHKDRFIVAFECVTTREAAQALQGAKLLGSPLEKSKAGDLWLHQLMDCEVVDQDGTTHGKVCGLEVTSASDLLVLDSGSLVPSGFIVSTKPGFIYVDVPAGLFDN